MDSQSSFRYVCGQDDCDEAFETLIQLYTHVILQTHGKRRTAEEWRRIYVEDLVRCSGEPELELTFADRDVPEIRLPAHLRESSVVEAIGTWNRERVHPVRVPHKLVPIAQLSGLSEPRRGHAKASKGEPRTPEEEYASDLGKIGVSAGDGEDSRFFGNRFGTSTPAEELSLLRQTRRKQEILSRLMAYFYSKFPWDTTVYGVNSHAGYNSSGGGAEPGAKLGSDDRRPAKRRAIDEDSQSEGDYDEDGSDDRPQPSEGFKDGTMVSKKRLACPYFKHNPRRYRKEKTCAGPPGLNGIHRVKEHLYRNHTLPLHCMRCYKQFEKAAELKDHARKQKCEISDKMFFEGLDEEQAAKLRSKKRSGGLRSEAEKWSDIYCVLFPEDSEVEIPTPYYEYDSSPDCLNMTGFKDYLQQHLPRYVRKRLEDALDQTLGPLEEELKKGIEEMIEAGTEELFRTYQTIAVTSSKQHYTVVPNAEGSSRKTAQDAGRIHDAQTSRILESPTLLKIPPVSKADLALEMRGRAAFAPYATDYTSSWKVATPRSFTAADPDRPQSTFLDPDRPRSNFHEPDRPRSTFHEPDRAYNLTSTTMHNLEAYESLNTYTTSSHPKIANLWEDDGFQALVLPPQTYAREPPDPAVNLLQSTPRTVPQMPGLSSDNGLTWPTFNGPLEGLFVAEPHRGGATYDPEWVGHANVQPETIVPGRLGCTCTCEGKGSGRAEEHQCAAVPSIEEV